MRCTPFFNHYEIVGGPSILTNTFAGTCDS